MLDGGSLPHGFICVRYHDSYERMAIHWMRTMEGETFKLDSQKGTEVNILVKTPLFGSCLPRGLHAYASNHVDYLCPY